MGENEQGGMLRTVVVIGIIAMVALIVTLGVVGLKNNMNKQVNDTTSLVAKQANKVTDYESTTIFKYGNFNEDAKTVAIAGFDESKPNWASYSRDLSIPSEYVKGGVTYNVVSINDNAFKNRGLTSVIIPNTITSIGRSGFADNKLTSVTIPTTVTNIGYAIFSGNKLTSVTIPNTVKSIDAWAFYNNNLTSVTIPSSVESIGLSAFGYNNKLTSVTVPSTVTSLDGQAFDNTVKIDRR